jgi:amphi-Trp domain-containing protein
VVPPLAGRRTLPETTGKEWALSDVEVKRTETLTRAEVAKLIAALADSLAGDSDEAHLQLGDTRIKLKVPDRMQAEIEIEVDGDEVELELELKWSHNCRRSPARTTRSET